MCASCNPVLRVRAIQTGTQFILTWGNSAISYTISELAMNSVRFPEGMVLDTVEWLERKLGARV